MPLGKKKSVDFLLNSVFVRESLGGALLEVGDAKATEQVFRNDLERNPCNPRALFGLAEPLTRQSRSYEASWAL